MENDEIGNKLDKVDGWLTKFGNILKKHWGKLLLIGFGYFVYWAMSLPADEEEAVQDLEAVDSTYFEDSTAE